MGYSHYWRMAPREIPADLWGAFTDDCRKIFARAQALHFKLGDDESKGEPVVTEHVVAFNGLEHCGHHQRQDALRTESGQDLAQEGSAPVSGGWSAGALASKRECSGDCSCEPCIIVRDPQLGTLFPGDWPFESCKTRYKPYDVVVTAVLLTALHHFGAASIRIGSDGGDKDWYDGQQLCALACNTWPALPGSLIPKR